MRFVNHVIPALAEQMPFAKNKMVQDHVHVFLNISVILIVDAVPNVSQIMIVHLTAHVWIISVKTHARVFAVKMLSVKWLNIRLVAHVWKVIPEILSVLVMNHLHHRVRIRKIPFVFISIRRLPINILLIQNKMINLVYRHLVDRTVSVGKLTAMLFALVYRTLLAQHQIAAPSVSYHQNVHKTRHVSIRNVQTHAQALVDRMHAVKSLTIIQFARVHQTLLAIHSFDAYRK